jgi:hypothetical protein
MFDSEIANDVFNPVTGSTLRARSSWAQQALVDEWTVSPVEAVRTFFLPRSVVLDQWWAVLKLASDPWLERELVTGDVIQLIAKLNATELRREELAILRELMLKETYTWVGHQELVAEPLPERVFERQELPTEPKPDQLTFLLKGDFAPSKRLTEFWVRGVKAFAQGAGVPLSSPALASTETELKQEFARALAALFGANAQQLRHGAPGNLHITQMGRFLLEYQIRICDQFFIVPDEATEFLQQLREELTASVLSGSTIAGGWGRIAVNASGELCYILAAAEMISDPAFVRSEEVE